MPRPPSPLPQDLQSWLQDGPDARPDATQRLPVVFISFGASFVAPEAALPALAHAIASTRAHMRFAVRLREREAAALRGALEKQGAVLSEAELLVRERFPQNDLLGQPGVAAFVTQAGYLSVQEAAWHGVPVGGWLLVVWWCV